MKSFKDVLIDKIALGIVAALITLFCIAAVYAIEEKRIDDKCFCCR